MPISIGLGLGMVDGAAGNAGLPSWAVGADMWKDFSGGNGSMSFPTDTHAQTIYSQTASGLLVPFAANVLTRTDLGLQTVPTRTQLCAVSPVDFTAWANTNLIVTAAATTAPDGTLTGSQLDDGVAAGVHSSAAAFSTVSGTTYTASFLVKDVDRRYAQILFGSAGHGVNAYANFDLQTGALGTVGSAATATITAVGAWYLITCTAPATATAGGSFQLVLITSATSARAENYTGTNKKIYAWSGQCEAAAFAASRILTASATVNGNQQVISGLSSQLATGVAGLIQVNLLQAGLSFKSVFQVNDGAAGNRLLLYGTTAGALFIELQTGGVSQGVVLIPGGWIAGINTIVFAAANNYFTARVVGQAAAIPDTITPNGWPVMDRVSIGGSGINANDNDYQLTRKLALDFLSPSDDPATKFAEWYGKAQLAAAS